MPLSLMKSSCTALGRGRLPNGVVLADAGGHLRRPLEDRLVPLGRQIRQRVRHQHLVADAQRGRSSRSCRTCRARFRQGEADVPDVQPRVGNHDEVSPGRVELAQDANEGRPHLDAQELREIRAAAERAGLDRRRDLAAAFGHGQDHRFAAAHHVLEPGVEPGHRRGVLETGLARLDRPLLDDRLELGGPILAGGAGTPQAVLKGGVDYRVDLGEVLIDVGGGRVADRSRRRRPFPVSTRDASRRGVRGPSQGQRPAASRRSGSVATNGRDPFPR